MGSAFDSGKAEESRLPAFGVAPESGNEALMPWWGWLLVSILGLFSSGAIAAIGYLVHGYLHMFDNF